MAVLRRAAFITLSGLGWRVPLLAVVPPSMISHYLLLDINSGSDSSLVPQGFGGCFSFVFSWFFLKPFCFSMVYQLGFNARLVFRRFIRRIS